MKIRFFVLVFIINLSCKNENSHHQENSIHENEINIPDSLTSEKKKVKSNETVLFDKYDSYKENNIYQGKIFKVMDCEECDYDITSIIFNDQGEENIMNFFGGPLEHSFRYRIENDTVYFKYLKSDGRIEFEEQVDDKSYNLDSGIIYNLDQNLIMEVYSIAPFLSQGKYVIVEE